MKSNTANAGTADLHMHSTASDGTFSPSELAVCAKKAGLRAAALTDHDTLSGLREFCFACERLGIEPVPGIEIGAKFKCELHIVGLFVDYKNREFAHITEELSKARAKRNYKMIDLLREGGINITAEDILSQKQDRDMNLCGRAHFAAALVKKGYAADTDDAFARYIGRGGPFYAPRKIYPPKETIEIIKNAGGLAIAAHPIFISRVRGELEELFNELKSYGLDGVECYYSTYDDEFSKMCLDICKKLDLAPSGGSDFHGANKPNIPIGAVNGGAAVPYGVVEGLKERLKK